MYFTVLPLLLLISRHAWEAHFDATLSKVLLLLWPIPEQACEAHFDATSGGPALVADLSTSLGSTFKRFLRCSRSCG